MKTDGKKSLSALVKAACNLNHIPNNHSKIPIISSQNTNIVCMENLLKLEIERTKFENKTSHEIAGFLHENIHSLGKIAKIPFTQRHEKRNIRKNEQIETIFQKEEQAKWEYVKNCKDPKCLWDSINIKGEIKANHEEEETLDIDELASTCSSRSKIDYTQALFTDLVTDTKNTELDRDIDKREVEQAVNNLKDSKTSDGIAANTVKKILPTIITLLLMLFNLMFKGGKDAYPSIWLSFVNALPKKGRLQLPKCVRFITVMGIFEKIYQIILSNRLYKFLIIPSPQSAYQTGKGCNLHVMSIRLLKALAKKAKKKLYIIFTDFEAAFDLVSRRLLFKKLIKLGISSMMLNALIAIYMCSKSVVEYNNQFSDYLLLLAGVKQGGPPSGLLYIAYTMGLIDMYTNSFRPEPLIYIYHMLVHADDILMLATSRQMAIEKMLALLEYCSLNYIKLQLTKCASMCVNSTDPKDEEPLLLQNLALKVTSKEVYLGSVITNSTKIEDDVKADIKHRQISIVKYFAFLRCNRNAPIWVKTMVLDACLISSLLYNSETWASANIDQLEITFRRILKSILGVGMTICNEFIYIELGIISIKTRVRIKQWKFWKNVLEMGDDNPIVYIIKEARRMKLKEVKYYDELVGRYSSTDEIAEEFFEKIRCDIRNKAIQGKSKYITYLQINPNLSTPNVYSNLQKQQDISMIGKLRTSSHNLHIEMGRRMGMVRERRVCSCGNAIEDEEHFLVKCAIYIDIREKHDVKENLKSYDILNDGNYVQYIKELYERRKAVAVP